MNLSTSERQRRIALVTAGLALMVGVPALNLGVEPGSLLHVPDHWVPLLGKYICYAILALSLDLVWGYVGVLSLGHGAFFA
ncbi:MAG: urea ABC transporter permease subunit UrtC, partial [Deltaproteobacteria bacterium]|nr:urea ABC transporter permease subunit UrtC [Deltaproteobacteria bacterium]